MLRQRCRVAFAALGTVTGLAAIFLAPAFAAPAAPVSSGLKLNQIQIVGTAESYKLAPSPEMLSLIRMGGKKDAQALDFSQPPLAAQLDAGARALSFDIVYDPQGGLFKNPAGASMADELLDQDYVDAMSGPGFKVIHVPDVDFKSSCNILKACLAQVSAWSSAHPSHVPLIIVLHCIDSKTPMPGATTPLAFDAAAAAALDAEIHDSFTASQLITPAQIKGTQASLKEAVEAGNWPTLTAASGKILFVLDDGPKIAALYSADPARPMFVATEEASPNAAFVSIEDPVKDGARITADIRVGLMVITRADAETVEARDNNTNRREWAFGSGAQVVLTDFLLPDKAIGPYQVTIADRRHARCDALIANCAIWDAAGQRTAVTAR
jgi:Phosphoinositide phospholipase C, Ca2+-dependent